MTAQWKRIPALLLALALTVFTAACSQDEESPSNPAAENEAPELPPADVMAVDLETFDGAEAQGSSKVKTTDEPTPSDSSNYVVAKATAIAVNSAVLAGIAPAAVAFAGAFLVQPVEQEDGSWLWSYQAVYSEWVLDLQLTGKREGSETVWALRVSTDDTNPALVDYLWYEGRCPYVPITGYWQFYDPTVPEAPVQLLRLEWSRASAVERSATFTVNRPGGNSEGDRLEYAQDGSAALMQYHDASAAMTWDVQWNIETEAGSVIVPYYSRGERACWDEDHLNAVCP
jgi:hypothetical protein